MTVGLNPMWSYGEREDFLRMLLFQSNDFLKYVVSMPGESETLSFYKSKLSEKWWMEVPYASGKERYSRNSIVPCSYNDYQTALKGEIPERYINTMAKLI
jgi:formiminoglutamase